MPVLDLHNLPEALYLCIYHTLRMSTISEYSEGTLDLQDNYAYTKHTPLITYVVRNNTLSEEIITYLKKTLDVKNERERHTHTQKTSLDKRLHEARVPPCLKQDFKQ